jgi:hypothetical protein
LSTTCFIIIAPCKGEVVANTVCWDLAVQAPAAEQHLVAEAALEAIGKMAQWVCQPLQGRSPLQQTVRQETAVAQLLAQATGSNGRNAGSGSSNGGSFSSICIAAAMSAGRRQVQTVASDLASTLAAAAVRKGAATSAVQLAATARALRCVCTGFAPSYCDDRKASGSASSHARGGGNWISTPIHHSCMQSQPGAQLVQIKLATPAAVLLAVSGWVTDSSDIALSPLLPHEVCNASINCCCAGEQVSWHTVADFHIRGCIQPEEDAMPQGGCQSAAWDPVGQLLDNTAGKQCASVT